MIASICSNHKCKRIYKVQEADLPGLNYSHGVCSLECTLILYPDFQPETNHVSGMETAEGSPRTQACVSGTGVVRDGGPVCNDPLAF